MTYSQHGEDTFLLKFFKRKPGTLISFGENDGVTLSNVKALIDIGWAAHLVEPSEICFKKLHELHIDNPKVRCYNYAIGSEDGVFPFFESGSHLSPNDYSLLSTLKPEEMSRIKGDHGFEEKTVQVKTWDSFMRDCGVPKFDLLSIDCEGMDFEILSQIDFKKYRPKMVVVESNRIEDNKYKAYMKKFGYRLSNTNPCNLFFTYLR